MFKKLTIVTLMLLVGAMLFAGGQEEAAAGSSTVSDTEVVEEAVMSYFAEMPDHIYKIAQAEFVEKVMAGEEMTIIDIRRADDYAAGHIKGAINLPWGTDALVENIEYLPQSGDVYIYCYSGQTAGQAVMLFNMIGVPARSVNLGFNFGISKVDGVDAALETTENAVDTGMSYDVDPALAAAYKAYYADMAGKSGTTFANNIVSEANAKAILDAGDEDVAFVSIRRAEHYAEGHIETATNLPWGKGMQELFASLPADKKLIVYCYTGQTAGQTVAALRVLGYDAVSLRGGMGMASNAPLGWVNAGYPVVQ